MKVLLIDVNYKESSSGKIVHSIAKHLQKENHEAIVAFGRGKPSEDKNVYKTSIDVETMCHAALTRLLGLNGCFSPFSTRRLLRLIAQYQPDVIHLHELHGYYVNIFRALKYISKKKIPVVWTFHCEYMYTGRCGIAKECTGYLTGCGKCPHKDYYPRTQFFDFSRWMLKNKKKCLENLDHLTICSPSKWLDNRVATSFLGSRNHVVVYNGVDTGVFHPYDNGAALREQYGIGDRKVILSVASDILKRTGDAIPTMAKKLPDYVFVMIGVKEIPDTKPENVLMFQPTRDQKWLAQMYSMADLCMICSERETFSLPCAEAMCCGTPVAGFRAGGPEETFAEPFARFCEYGNYDHLAEMIRLQLLQGPEQKKCCEYGFENFSESAMNNKYLKHYCEILEEGK